MKRFFVFTGLFESNFSAAEWAWRIFQFLVVAGGGTTAAIFAKASDLFSSAGLIAWVLVGAAFSLLLAAIFALLRYAQRESAEADFLRGMALREASINPLRESFADTIIRVHDLHLPGSQIHKNKHFKRCKFVGPGAVAILGGSFMNCLLSEYGNVIVLPERTLLTGILVFENCTIEHCEFYSVTVFTNRPAGETFNSLGIKVVGI